MPRSGTTLVESIIGSSNLAISGGELRSMYELFKNIMMMKTLTS